MREYFGIIYRKIQKNPLETVNKIAGLTLAVVACLLIAFYVNDELSYDRFHSKKDRVYRLVHYNAPIFPKLMYMYLKDIVPGVEKLALFTNWDTQNVFMVNQTTYQEKGVFIADSDIFDILDFNITESQSIGELLAAPNTMLISRKMAEKYFPDESAVGKIIRYNNQYDMNVTGVFDNFPDQSHVNPQFLISSTTAVDEYGDKSWGAQYYHGYVLLSPNVSPEEAAERIKMTGSRAGLEAENLLANATVKLQPLTDIYLHSTGFNFDYVKKGDIDFVRMIMMIGVLILLVAGANHINLTITQTMSDTKQFAVMKTMGGLPHQIRQYIYVGILFDVVTSVALAVLITLMILPIFGNVVEKHFVLGLDTWLYMACLLIAIVIVLTFITAVYPAFLFSRVPVMRIFQKSYKIGGENLRKGLIVFQFTVSVVLIASTIFMYQQMQLITTEKLGFNKEQLFIIKNPISDFSNTNLLTVQYERFKTQVDQLPAVKSVGNAFCAPVGVIGVGRSMKKQGDNEIHYCEFVYSNFSYLSTIQAHFLAGNDFTESGVFSQIILSRKMLETIGETPENIIGSAYEIDGNMMTVVGVVDDIQYYPLLKTSERENVVFGNKPFPLSIVVRTSKGDWRNTIAQLEKAWKEAAPEWPFVYEMMDERLQRSYQKELADIRTITAFSVVAIFLSCFGVMGISRYTARKRTKEIAIRKVNGASKKDIMLLLNSNFMALNLIAFVIAIPVVILFINNWLQNFSYKTKLDWWVFVLAGLATAVVVVATVSWQSWRAANANPVEVLKSE